MNPEDKQPNSPVMEPSVSTGSVNFQSNYDALLKEVLEESSEDDEEMLNHIDIDLNTATAELPEDLRAALEDRSLADKYLADLKTFMSHQRSQSIASDYSTPNTPRQSTFFNQPLSPKLFERSQPDPLSKVLDAIPYHTRLINGVPPLTVLEQKFHALRIPELDLPVVSDTVIQTRLNDLHKIREDLHIHLNGGPLVSNPTQNSIGKKKKQQVIDLLEEVFKEIGLYEEFVKKANYLELENILNETDHSDEDFEEDGSEVDSSLLHFDSPSEAPSTPRFQFASSSSSQRTGSNSLISSQLLNQRLDLSNDAVSLYSSSDFAGSLFMDDDKGNMEPWEAFKWTPLIKISDQLYSEEMKRESGLISVMAVSGVIAIGTTRSLVFVYDYSQNLKCILGDSTRAIELGSVTSLAISADHTTIACGHSQGYIVVWDMRKPASPIRVIDPISANQVAGAISTPQQQVPRKEGHVKGASILHIGFVGVKKSDIVSGDDQGMAFYHTLYKVIMVNAVDTTRILGRYQNLSLTPEIQRAQTVAANARMRSQSLSTPFKMRRPSTVFAMQPLPLGQIPHPAESFGLVALLTPYKMIIVGLKPTTQTLYKFLKSKATISTPDTASSSDDRSKANIEPLSGCLAWLPVLRTGNNEATKETANKGKDKQPNSDPMLAFAWGNHLFILRVVVEQENKQQPQNSRAPRIPTPPQKPSPSKKGLSLEFVKVGEWKCKEAIVGIQWINRQILVLFTSNEEMILFDPKKMVMTQQTSVRNKQLIYHDWFNTPLKDLVIDAANLTMDSPENSSILKSVEMAYFSSIKGYKGKLFLLGMKQIYIGTLLSWKDRILALVQAGDFLESIELATSFYNGVGIQTVIGLPEEEKARKSLVGEHLMDLLVASLNYAFSSKRTYEGMANEIAGGEMVLFRDLAQGCIEACLSMNNTEFLFDVVYERFADNKVKGVFLEVLEPCIVADRIPDVPPSLMKDLVDHYSKKRLLDSLEQVIWHVNPRHLDIDQVVSMCHREGMYEAMMYVWNKSMHDYVSPVVEMLKVVRAVLRQEEGTQQASHIRQNAEKLFDYLKLILTGRSFPEGTAILDPDEASDARSAIYSFVFSGRCVVWPPIGGKLVLTAEEDEGTSEPTYPYLRLLLRFSTKKFLETLEVAFEDPWLNGGEDILSSRFEDEVPGKVISRQIIVNTLLDVMGGGSAGNSLPLPPPRPKQSISASTVQSFGTNRPNLHINVPSMPYNESPSVSTNNYISNENLILLYMFIATNLHMYTTFILLPPKTLYKVLVRLAEDHDPDTRAEREKAVSNLLMVFTPSHEEQLVQLYEEAGFWKVLEHVYRRDEKYGKLVEAYLKDDECREMVFECVEGLLGSNDLRSSQKEEIKRVFMIRISQFVEIDGQKTAHIVESYLDSDHTDVIRRLEEDQEFDDEENHVTADKRLFSYLRGLLEPSEEQDEQQGDEQLHQGLIKEATIPQVDSTIQERYIELMCRFDPSGVFNYFNTKLSNEVSLDKIQKCCEQYGVIDAVVWIMEKNGDTSGALDKMLEVAKEKDNAILSILKEHQSSDKMWTFEEQNTVNSCLIGLNGVLRVGTHLCENSSRLAVNTYQAGLEDNEEEENIPELSRGSGEDSSVGNDSDVGAQDDATQNDHVVETLWFRLLDAYVEASIDMYNALSNKASAPTEIHHRIVNSFKSFVQSILTSLLLSTSPQVSLPRLLQRLITSQARGETTFANFREIFLSMLDTYKYEGQLLELTNRLFDRDLFGSLQDMVIKRSKGWRPTRSVCEICGASILDLTLLHPPLAWGIDDQPGLKANEENDEEEEQATEHAPTQKRYAVFHCGHGFHTECLDRQLGTDQECIICQHGNPQAKPALPPITTTGSNESVNTTKSLKGKEKAT
ncbi:Golgi CORVET complex core vacuolar protein 8-domain-containing protein [Choanephora cucurbitarum]|nr:Golgi CORVET complex core vacuolar protein 8-domain-containing protein [Choanephora cucurbitarum]